MKHVTRPILVFVVMIAALTAYGQTSGSATPSQPKSTDELYKEARQLGAEILNGIDDTQATIDKLEDQIKSLKSLGSAADDEIADLRKQIDLLTGRAQELGDRYTSVLTMAQSLKKELELTTTTTLVFGGTTAILAGVLITLAASGSLK